jgi:N-acetylmuramic acid 6-phosphate etherase
MFTENPNPATTYIDTLDSLEIVRLINGEDQNVARAVAAELPNVALAIDQITSRMKIGGRLIYIGAGTSGRLGVLDAAECPPTFNTSPEQVIALIAGGAAALTQALEGVEDDANAGIEAISAVLVTDRDSVVGISASGCTPYTMSGMLEAHSRGALVISIACNPSSLMGAIADIPITVLVGEEVIAGSTRLKSGTAQKMVLNMISTGVMIRLGKTYGNLMVDLQAKNVKLKERARRIVAQACGISLTQATARLEACDGEVKTAIVSSLVRISPEEAHLRLAAAHGIVRQALSR